MEDQSLAGTGIALMKGGTDESIFAGLLLFTKCSPRTVAVHSSEVAGLVLGGGKRGFLRRLLKSKPQSESGEDGDKEPTAALLSQMQCLSLNVITSLCQTGGSEVRREMAKALSSTLATLLDSLASGLAGPKDTTAAAEEPAGAQGGTSELPSQGSAPVAPSAEGVSLSDSAAAMEQLLEALHTIYVSTEGRGEQQLCDDSFNWPLTLVSTLVAIIRACPEGEGGDASAGAKAEDEVGAGVTQLSKLASLASDLLLQALTAAPGRHVSSLESAASLSDGVSVDAANHRGTWRPGSSAKEGGPRVHLCLDILLQWCCTFIDPTVPPLSPDTRASLEAGPFAASLRRAIVVGLHGGASERMRDTALQLATVALSVLGGAWAVEATDAKSPKGSTVCVILGVTSTELRLVVDEALALFGVETDETDQGSGEEGPKGSPRAKTGSAAFETSADQGSAPRREAQKVVLGPSQKSARETRISRMAPVCLKLVEHVVSLLCEVADEEDESSSGEEAPWSLMAGSSLLSLQQTLHDVAGTIIEFLADARTVCATPPPKLRALAVECGRCLACWLAQESSPPLRKELAKSKALLFLLSFSAYAKRPGPASMHGSGDLDSVARVATGGDVIDFLLPALLALADEDTDMVLESGAHEVAAAFVATELSPTLATSSGSFQGERVVPLVWAMGLLLQLLESPTTILSSASLGLGFEPFDGTLASHPCFGLILPQLAQAGAALLPAVAPRVDFGVASAESPEAVSMLRLAADHAAALLVVIEHCCPGIEQPHRRAADAVVAGFLGRSEQLGESADPSIAAALELARERPSFGIWK